MPLEPSVHCPRIGCARTVQEHAECPYCYGKESDIAPGDRARFCDYDAKKDPVTFGFPPEASRFRLG